MRSDQTAVWSGHAGNWTLLGSPLRPCAADAGLMQELLAPAFTEGSDSKRVAVLGVTPELVNLEWPTGTQLHAFDQSASMLETVWQPNARIASSAHLASWQKLPVNDGFFDAFVGDGSFNAMPSFDDYGDVFAELSRASSPDALLVLRCFIRPSEPETVVSLRSAALSGEVDSFHGLKLRLNMLVSASGSGVVHVRDVYDLFSSEFDREELAARTGWPRAVIDTIGVYEGSPTTYTYPTLSQLQALCEPHWFMDQLLTAGYDLSDRCPTIRLRRT